MSTATETCACGASITVDVRDGLTLGWRLSDWRREHRHDLDAADACRERDEARAEVERLRADLEAVEARAEQAEAAIARVRALCDGEWLWSVPITYITAAIDGGDDE